jgi:hypothetical protein
MARRRILRLASACLAVAAAWACGPVYIPVPPPSQTTFTLDTTLTNIAGDQFWIAAGGPEPRAARSTYYILDQERNAGVIAGANSDGSYLSPPMAGTAGDHIVIHYKDRNGKLSASACLLLGEQRPTAQACPRP